MRSIAPLIFSVALPLQALADPPEAAAAQGYNVNTFSSNFTLQTVDMNNTRNRGFKWYLFDLYSITAKSTGVLLRTDGSVTLIGDATGADGQLMSVSKYPGTDTYTGTAFGGGAYIEAVLHYDPALVAKAHAKYRAPYPAFWGLPMEGNIIAGADQWLGQPAGYIHDVETDFFEADYPTKPTAYGAGMHDWYGIEGKTCPPGLCGISFTNPSGERDPPAGTDFTQYHTYGFLWVPATPTTNGYVSAYFDGAPIGGTHEWTQFTDQAPTPVGQPWLFGRVDQQHIFFILGTGEGENMTVQSVNVWQQSASSNLIN